MECLVLSLPVAAWCTGQGHGSARLPGLTYSSDLLLSCLVLFPNALSHFERGYSFDLSSWYTFHIRGRLLCSLFFPLQLCMGFDLDTFLLPVCEVNFP